MAKIYKEIDFSKYSSVKIGGMEKVEILGVNSEFSYIFAKISGTVSQNSTQTTS